MDNNQNNYQNKNQYYNPNPMPNQYYAQPQYVPPYFNQQQYQMQQQILAKRNKQKSELRLIGLALGIALFMYLVIQTISGSILQSLGLYDVYKNSSVFQSCFGVFAEVLGVAMPFGIMALVMKNKYDSPVIPTAKVGKANSAAWICVGMGVCILANYAASIVDTMFKSIGKNAGNTDSLDPDSIFACAVQWIALAIIPPICEEFAMRCCSLGLLMKYGKGFAVLAVSLIFGMMHGNIIQFVFATIVGLILAYVTVQTGSIVPAMLIHGFNNGRSTLNSTITYLYNEKTAEYVLVATTIAWAALAIAGAIYLAIKKQFHTQKQPNYDPAQLSLGTKFGCILPGLAIPFLLLTALAIFSLNNNTL